MVAVLVAALVLIAGQPGDSAARVRAATPMAETTPVVFVDPLTRHFPVPPDAEIIYAIGNQALYRSQDGGQMWAFAGPLPPAEYLAIGDSGSLLAGDHIHCRSAGGEPPPLSRSDDGGLTWQPVAGTAGIRPVVTWSEASLTLGARCAGLLRSADGGQNWEILPLPDTSYEATAIAPIVSSSDSSAASALVLGTSGGGTSRVWRADLALPADQVYTELNLEPFWGRGAVAAHEDMYLIGTAQGVFVSTDAGQTFSAQPIRAGLGGILSVDPLQASIPEAERGFGVSAVAIDPTDVVRFYAGTADGAYTSSDAGQTWQKIAGIEGPVSGLVVRPGGAQLFAETDNGVVAVPLQS
jgi:photosystem II stability/assembly factor-like uncharacterized protein